MILITGKACPKCDHLKARLKKEKLLGLVTVQDYGEMQTTVDGLEFLCRNELMEHHLPVLVTGDAVYEHEKTIVGVLKRVKEEG